MNADDQHRKRERAALRRHHLDQPVLVADRVPERLRRTEDLLEALLAFLGIILVIMIGLYAHSTTQGVADDVRQVLGGLVRQILRMPLTLIESLFVIIAPATVLISLAKAERYRSVVNVIITGAIAAIISWILILVLPLFPSALVDSLLVRTPTGAVISLDAVIIVLSAALTVATGQSRSVRYSWWGIWFLLLVSLVWGTATVPGMVVTVLLGRLIGCIARWCFGFDDRRALPADLVQGVLDIGLQPIRIVRSDVATTTEPLDTWEVSEAIVTTSLDGSTMPQLHTEAVADGQVSYEIPPSWGNHADRVYRLWTADGRQRDLHVLDPGQALTSTIGDVWDRLRLRGLHRWVSPNVQANAERSVLAAQTASTAGVFTPAPVGIGRGGDSVLVAWDSVPLVAPVLSVHDTGVEISDSLLEQAWMQLMAAHARGVAHRNLDVGSLTVDEHGNLWILDWHDGEVAASDLSRNIDCAQMLVHLALAVGPERALASTTSIFSVQELTAITVVIQGAILPTGIRRRLRGTEILNDLRTAVAEEADVAEAAVAPISLVRFSPKTLILFAVGAFALVVVLGSLNFDEIVTAIRTANPWWILATFLLGALTWGAAAIPLVAFSPVKISMWKSILVQVGASIINLVTPAGIGPAALNLRFLTKQKIKLPMAVATVTLVQISQVVTSVGLLVIVVAATGTSVSIPTPSSAVVWGVAAFGAIIAGIVSVPKVRAWLLIKSREIWEQVRPQLLWLVGHPGDLAKAILGNVLMNIGFIGAFGTALLAFDYQLSILSVTVTFLVANALGSAIPSPGGMGTTEAALTAGLQVAGVPPAIAVPAVLLFRLVTFYGRIPLAWLALRYIQKHDIV